jgi:hypothetical protein
MSGEFLSMEFLEFYTRGARIYYDMIFAIISIGLRRGIKHKLFL